MKEKEILKLIETTWILVDTIPDRKRVKQMERWLRKNFPTPYPVKVHVEKIRDGAYGECYRWNKTTTIRINKTIHKSEQLHSLIHEWAHAMTCPNPRLEKSGRQEHPDEWGLAYAKIYREWFDRGGFLTSTGIKVEKMIFELMTASEYETQRMR